jgi:hypothetical protein
MNLLFCTFILIILDIQFTITNEFTLLYIYINYIRHSIYRWKLNTIKELIIVFSFYLLWY